MENDSIRASGGDTLVDVWIEGKLRGISVSRGAIETFLGVTPDQAARMSEEDRCEFVRTHLAIVLTAAKLQLREMNSGAESISIDSGQLGGVGRGRVGIAARPSGARPSGATQQVRGRRASATGGILPVERESVGSHRPIVANPRQG